MRRPLILVPIVALALMVLATSAVAARSPIALGISSQASGDLATIDWYRANVGKPALWTIWSDWGDRGGKTRCGKSAGTCAFPTAMAHALRARKITPFIWWQPTDPANPDAGVYERHRNIIAGKHDAYIRTWAQAAKAFGKPVIVRMFHEMNSDWFPWGIDGNFDNSAGTLVKAWRHVVDIFHKVGARNVKFLWSPYNAERGGYADFYPGNAWVDYVGVTSLNWGNERWRELSGLLQRPMQNLRNVSRSSGNPQGKPVILPEVGSNHLGGDKAAWISNGYKHAYKKYPTIRAMVYLDYNTAAITVGQPDWRLAMPEDGSAMRAYQQVASQKLFRASIP